MLYSIFLIILTIILCITLYLFFSSNSYLESFKSTIGNHEFNVDIPLNNSSNCNNICGPLARCNISGEQCLKDADCSGCSNKLSGEGININDTMYPTGNSNIPTSYNKGFNTWSESYNVGNEIYQKRNDKKNPYVHYPTTYTLSSDFIENMPPAFNS